MKHEPMYANSRQHDMGLLIGIAIVGIVVWSYLRVLTRKRYPTRQTQAPDLNRFGETLTQTSRSTGRDQQTEGLESSRGEP